MQDTPAADNAGHPLLKLEDARCTSRVICFSPDHGKILPELALPAIEGVITTWMDHVAELSAQWEWVRVFENKGAVMGCSNPHLHGQIWGSDFLPNEIAREEQHQRDFTPEQAAERLRALSPIHYNQTSQTNEEAL